MNRELLNVPCLLFFLLGVGSTPALHAQSGDIGVRLHGGVVAPLSGAADYFRPGPSVGIDLGYPLNDRVSLVLDVDFDYVNAAPTYPTPPTRLWRYGLALESDLLGGRGGGGIIVHALAGGGLTTFRSKPFWLESRQPYTYRGERLDQTSVTGTAGFRLGLPTADGLTWWLTGRLNWTPVIDTNEEALRELAREELESLGSALSFALMLGVTLW